MEDLLVTLDRIGSDLAAGLASVYGEGGLRSTSDDDVLRAMAAASAVARRAEAVLIAAAGEVLARSESPAPSERLTTRLGCRSPGELVERATRVSRRTASGILTAAAAVREPAALTTGEALPPALPGMRSALAAGAVGIDGVTAVAAALDKLPVARDAILAADDELAAAARGDGIDGAPPACADDLRTMATVWATFLDQDGAEPRESRAMRRRGLALGICRDGLIPLRGNILPEVAGQLQRLFDAVLNPKVDGAPAPTGPHFVPTADGSDGAVDAPDPALADVRSRTQRQHDALVTILTTAAASSATPTLGGAAPTLLVSVRAEDIVAGTGFGHIGGVDEPVPIAAARHIACSGSVQRIVLDDTGRIIRLGTPDRVFGPHQRRAITLRDGGCIIPGCRVRAEWCEIHHVDEHSRGGPTHTDNGVLLCWHHHRTLDTGGWAVRMRHGTPEVRGPRWWDPHPRWRPATKSPTRQRDRLQRRRQ